MQTHDHMTARLLSPKAVEEEFGISRRLQGWLRATRQLPYYKVGHRTVLVSRPDLEKYLASRRVNAIGDIHR